MKNSDGRPDYFDELHEQIQEIRASEKGLYQKVKRIVCLK
ncbi:MAG TPA: RhuM family protein [Flavobacteriaceae bacterium]|nr:RhuM family protein [Flavobacteriaceae bacterium]